MSRGGGERKTDRCCETFLYGRKRRSARLRGETQTAYSNERHLLGEGRKGHALRGESAALDGTVNDLGAKKPMLT